ncbi:MAG: Rpn family recombination-promoting nuclease/putative transposase, partial [Planctomycetaceae bacterium]
MSTDNPLNAHDRFAAALLRMPHLMLRLLRLLLPPEVLAVMRPGGLRLCSELLIDQHLRKRHADALYRIPLRGGRQIYLYVMFEHKSWQDPLTALQLLTYIVSLMHHLRREGQRLAVVIPIVIYHGQTPWSTAVTLRQLVDAPEPLRTFLPDNQVIVLDLPRADERLFAGPLEYTARLRALIAGQLKAQLPQQLQQIFTMIARSKKEKTSHKALVQDILNYLSEV